MRRRGCLLSAGVIFGLLLLCCIVTYFVGVPRLRDNVADSLSDSLSTEVADQIAPASGQLEAGTYTLSVADLQNQLEANTDDNTASDFGISVTPDGMTIDFDSGGQTFGYHGTPTVRDGRLVIDDMQVDNEALGWIMPADRMADVIEDGVNNYFAAEGLEISDLQLGTDEIEFEVVPAN